MRLAQLGILASRSRCAKLRFAYIAPRAHLSRIHMSVNQLVASRHPCGSPSSASLPRALGARSCASHTSHLEPISPELICPSINSSRAGIHAARPARHPCLALSVREAALRIHRTSSPSLQNSYVRQSTRREQASMRLARLGILASRSRCAKLRFAYIAPRAHLSGTLVSQFVELAASSRSIARATRAPDLHRHRARAGCAGRFLRGAP